MPTGHADFRDKSIFVGVYGDQLIPLRVTSLGKPIIARVNVSDLVGEHGDLDGLSDYDHDQYVRKDLSQALTGEYLSRDVYDEALWLIGGLAGSGSGAIVIAFGKNHPTYPGELMLGVPNAAKDAWPIILRVLGNTDTPVTDWQGRRLTNLGAPVDDNDAARKIDAGAGGAWAAWSPTLVWTESVGDYASQYPPAQNDTYVKATGYQDGNYYPHFTTDPTKSLIDNWQLNQWFSAVGAATNQRFHIDLGAGKIITRIYYENAHISGTGTNYGARNFSLWGSNASGDFADLVYANDGTWVQLTTAASEFDQHVAANQVDPKYIVVTNTTSYRYYALKFSDNWGGSGQMGVRRIELQSGGAGAPPTGVTTYARWVQNGKVVFFEVAILCTDSKGVTNLTISTPSAPVSWGGPNPAAGFVYDGNTALYYAEHPFVNPGVSQIQYFDFRAGTMGKSLNIYCQGFYEVA